MIRWLLIALFIYLVYRLIMGPKSKQKRKTTSPFDQFQRGPSSRKKGPNLDQIEDAEFEDITDKEKKTDNS